MKVGTNSTPLIELSKINQLDVLRDVYGTILIPEAVYVEVVIDGIGQPGAAAENATIPILCASMDSYSLKYQILDTETKTVFVKGT